MTSPRLDPRVKPGRTRWALPPQKVGTAGVSRRPPRVLARALLLAAATATIGSISAAWACVPVANLVSLRPDSSGPAGSRIVVNGLGFSETPVEIRWNAPNGPRLAAAHGPNFSAKVTIPNAPAGLHTLIVLERQQDGSIGNAGSTPFDVTGRDETGSSPATGTDAQPMAEPVPSSERSWGPRWLAPAAAGIALVLVGALGGVMVTRSRRPPT